MEYVFISLIIVRQTSLSWTYCPNLLLLAQIKGLELCVFTITPVIKGNRKRAPVGLEGICVLSLTDIVLKLRSPQLGCGHSLETQLQILASVHPELLAPGGITKEAGFQTRTHGTVSWNTGKTGPWSFPLVLTEDYMFL